jgi:hypothetical protein
MRKEVSKARWRSPSRFRIARRPNSIRRRRRDTAPRPANCGGARSASHPRKRVRDWPPILAERLSRRGAALYPVKLSEQPMTARGSAKTVREQPIGLRSERGWALELWVAAMHPQLPAELQGTAPSP